MQVSWPPIALQDVQGCVLPQFLKPLHQRLVNLWTLGQARRCTSGRFPGMLYIKEVYWYVILLPLGPNHVSVIAVEYDKGQAV